MSTTTVSDGEEERVSFAKISRQQSHHRPSYGTASSRPALTDVKTSFIKHRVQNGETLQGIALKFSVTVQEIKQANNLWTNDSLYLREFLVIPVIGSPETTSDDVEKTYSINGQCENTVPDDDSDECVGWKIPQRESALPTSHRECSDMSPTSPSIDAPLLVNGFPRAPFFPKTFAKDLHRKVETQVSDVNRVDVKDYFSSFDTKMQKLKTDVEKLESRKCNGEYSN